ncbi:hypothetical protein DVH24_015366 [Malus domestica]|uniref:Uncharacterized protein n=1 Tax=Malus domestica TaxID=3750 RepID=A0A498K3M1_MALDO|nr:hypothetical protein DVH24_015366 [Malus domestica]
MKPTLIFKRASPKVSMSIHRSLEGQHPRYPWMFTEVRGSADPPTPQCIRHWTSSPWQSPPLSKIMALRNAKSFCLLEIQPPPLSDLCPRSPFICLRTPNNFKSERTTQEQHPESPSHLNKIMSPKPQAITDSIDSLVDRDHCTHATVSIAHLGQNTCRSACEKSLCPRCTKRLKRQPRRAPKLTDLQIVSVQPRDNNLELPV